MTAHEILIAAKALIPDEEHWYRGPREMIAGCYCPLTAIAEIEPSQKDAAPAKEALALAAFGRKLKNPVSSIINWNDGRASFKALHAAFDRAIKATAP